MSKSPLPVADIFRCCPSCGGIDAAVVCRLCGFEFIPDAKSSSLGSVGASGRTGNGVAPSSFPLGIQKDADQVAADVVE